MTLALLARRLQRATDLLSIADVVIECLLARRDVHGVALVGHRDDAPVIWIGDHSVDPARVRAYLAGGHAQDSDFARVVSTHTPVFVATASSWMLPILGASALFGTLRVHVADDNHPPANELVLIAAQVSIRLAALGVEVAPAETPLSARQREIAWLVARGCTNSEIANMLGCTSHAVKKQLSRVLVRLEVSNRTELAGIVGRWAEPAEPTPNRRCRVFLAPSHDGAVDSGVGD